MTPVFFLLVFGILEFGAAFRDYLTVNNSSQAGARAAAIAGDDADADYKIVTAVRNATSAMPKSQLLKVVVFKASGPQTPAPCTSLSSGQTSPVPCNVYQGANLDPTDPTAWSSCSSGPAQYYCATNRKTASGAANGNGPPDYIGIWVKVRHPWITGLFGNSIELTSTTITKLEARSVS